MYNFLIHGKRANGNYFKSKFEMKLLIKNVLLEGQKKDIYIEGNRILEIARKINKKADEEIDGKGQKAIFPGLINCHSHSAMSLFRGLGDDLPLKEWLENKIWPMESKLTEEDIYWGTKLALLEMIRSGTTTFNEMYWYPEPQVEATREMGLRGFIGLIMLDFSPLGSKETIEKNYQKLKKNLPKNCQLTIAPHAIYTVSEENLIWAKNFSKEKGLLLHIHLSETEREVNDCLEKYKLRPVEYLEKIGFLEGNCVFAHSIWLLENEIKILKKWNCSVVYCPCSNMKLASGIFPYKKLKDMKVNICLGTDSAASNNNLDLFEEMKFASLLQKINEMEPTVAPASEIFKIATENPAYALKINLGQIKPGRLADLILIDLNEISLVPGYNLISDLVYSSNGNCVSDVICDGKILMRERKIKKEDEILNYIKKRYKNEGLSIDFRKENQKEG